MSARKKVKRPDAPPPVRGSRMTLERLDSILLRSLALTATTPGADRYLKALGEAAHGLRALRAVMFARGLLDDGVDAPEALLVAP
jgi:hypothetical protein